MSIKEIRCKNGEYEYDEKNKLGAGGFAKVYKGKNRSTGEVIAVKCIHKRRDYGWKEMKIMKDLTECNNNDNNHLVPLLDYSIQPDCIYLVMPIYEHGSLRDYIKRNGPLNQNMVVNVFSQLVEIINYLHKVKDIMHRDISAANIFIKKKDGAKMEVVLGDFGLAKILEEKNAVKATCVGTPGYMAPEIEHGKYSIESELYSLGGVLYFMFTGEDPSPKVKKAQLAKIYEDRYGAAADLLKRLWEEDPNQRIKLNELTVHSFVSIPRRSAVAPKQNLNTSSAKNERSRSRECKHVICLWYRFISTFNKSSLFLIFRKISMPLKITTT